jgi:hypothetical protein
MNNTHDIRSMCSIIVKGIIDGTMDLDKARVATNTMSKQLTSLRVDIETAKLEKRTKLLPTKL